MNRYEVTFCLALPDKLHREVLALVGDVLRRNGFEPEGLNVQGLADDITQDQLLYGSSFEQVFRDGTRVRIDPRRIRISHEDDDGADHLHDSATDQALREGF